MNRILEVKDLRITFPIKGKETPAVDGISFSLNQGEVLGIVGESGCGKTVTALSLLRLIEDPGRIASGHAYYFGDIAGISPEKPKVKTGPIEETTGKTGEADLIKDVPKPSRSVDMTASVFTQNLVPEGGIDLFKLSEAEMRRVRGNKIGMIFQEPMTSLNPVFTVGYQIREAIQLHQKVSKKEANDLAVEILRKVHIPDPQKRIKDYPHQLSGGMRQRVMIAMALSCQPDILIADEPTTALDVTIQAQILDLIQELIDEMHMSVILITHDLGVVSQICDEVVVMYSGMIVEQAPAERLFRRPKHPYTIGLLNSIPKLFEDRGGHLMSIPGMVPDLSHLPEGCRFADRCFREIAACKAKVPSIRYFGEGQEARCINT